MTDGRISTSPRRSARPRAKSSKQGSATAGDRLANAIWAIGLPRPGKAQDRVSGAVGIRPSRSASLGPRGGRPRRGPNVHLVEHWRRELFSARKRKAISCARAERAAGGPSQTGDRLRSPSISHDSVFRAHDGQCCAEPSSVPWKKEGGSIKVTEEEETTNG